MSEALGPLSYGQQDEQIFLGREIAQHRDYSEETANLIDSEISRLVKESYQRARDILKDNRDILDKLAEMLLEKETVMGKELDELIYDMRPGFTLPSDQSNAADKEAEPDDEGDNASTDVADAQA
jgi:cell division protease FtsH